MANKNKYLLISRRLARQLYCGQITPAHLDQALTLQTFFDLKQATEQNPAKSVFSKGFEKCIEVLLLHRFLFRFATAKTYTQLYQMSKRLDNGDKQRSWNDFKKEAEKIDRVFNDHNLKFECQQLIHNSAIWNERHPYFIRVTAGSKKVKQAVEQSKTFAPYFTVYRFKNNSVEVSPFADTSDLKENYCVAKILIDNQLAKKVQIRHHIYLPGVKNAEFDIDGVVGDHIAPKTDKIKRGISSAFDEKLGKNKQLRGLTNTFLAINLSRYPLSNTNIEAIASQSWQRFNHYTTVSYIILIHEKKAVKLHRYLIGEGYGKYKYEIAKMQKED